MFVLGDGAELVGAERSQRAGLIAELLLAIHPEIVRVAGLEILLCLGQQGGIMPIFAVNVSLRLGIDAGSDQLYSLISG